MSRNATQRYLLCYDIADPRRLQRVHRRAKRDGVALQYSLFECHVTPAQLQRLTVDLRVLIDPGADDVRIYGARFDARIIWIGREAHIDGVLLFNNPLEAARRLRRGDTLSVAATSNLRQGHQYSLDWQEV